MTIPEKAQVGCSSWISSVAEGRAWLRARAKCFATFALDADVDGVDFCGDEGSIEPPETSSHYPDRPRGGTSVELPHSMLGAAARDYGMHHHGGAATADDALLFPFLFRAAATAGQTRQIFSSCSTLSSCASLRLPRRLVFPLHGARHPPDDPVSSSRPTTTRSCAFCCLESQS
jgi:hypothetical protein